MWICGHWKPMHPQLVTCEFSENIIHTTLKCAHKIGGCVLCVFILPVLECILNIRHAKLQSMFRRDIGKTPYCVWRFLLHKYNISKIFKFDLLFLNITILIKKCYSNILTDNKVEDLLLIDKQISIIVTSQMQIKTPE